MKPLLQIGLLRDIASVPLIYPPAHQAEFEAHAYSFFAATPYYPKKIYDKGIYSKYANGTKYHDKTGKTTFSKRNILTPVYEVYDLESISAVMYNLHSEFYRARAIDIVMDAWEQGIHNASAVTPLIQLVQDPTNRPASLMVYPIAPPENLTSLVGFVRIVQNWDTVLSQATPSDVDGIDFIVGDGIQQVTFTISGDRQVSYKGAGDIHDRAYDNFKRTYSAFKNTGYSAYTVVYYPNSSYFPSTLIIGPIVGCVAIMVMILLIATLVGVYYYIVNRELQQKQEALDSKRSFVRFISHEIRTPLNTVCLGLKVLQDEAKVAVAEGVLEAEQVSEKAVNVVVPADMAVSALDETKFDGANEMAIVVSQGEMSAANSYMLEEVANWLGLMKDIEESANNAVEVLNELMSYDKIEMRTMQIEKEPVLIWDLLAKSIKPFYIQAQERGLHLRVLLAEDFSTADADAQIVSEHILDERVRGFQQLLVIGDSVRLTQVFRNIISNALKFSYPGTEVIVRTTWVPDNMLTIGE